MGALFRGMLWIAARIPQSWAARIASILGGVMRLGQSRSTHTMKANLRVCFPDKDAAWIEQVVRQRAVHLVLMFFEFAYLLNWDLDRLLASIIEVEGESELRRAFEDDAGVLLLVPHFGNWEMMAAFLGAHYSMAALYDAPKIKSLEPVILEAREKFSGRMFRIDTAGMRGMFKEMKQGRLVLVLPDQVPARNAGEYADFFGQPALTMTLAHRLMQRTEPHVIMGSVQRTTISPEIKYKLTFTPLPDIDRSTPQQCAQDINAAIEQVVLEAPEQYQWEYKRFRRPQGARKNDIYRRQ